MSTYWDVHCRTCDEGLGLYLNHEEETMHWLISQRDALAAFGRDFDRAGASGRWGYGEVRLGDDASVDCEWFAKHAGHDLVPRDEYGGYADRCGHYWVKCGECGKQSRCLLPLGHSGEHATKERAPSPDDATATEVPTEPNASP